MTTALHDIADVQAFAAEHLRLTGLTLGADEREDMHAEAVALLYALESSWDGRGRFSGYASRYLPARVISAWRKQHREHSYRSTPDGGRAWDWGRAPDSLDRPVAQHGGGESKLTLADLTTDPRAILGAVPSADPLEQVTTDVPQATNVGTPVHLVAGGDLVRTVRGALRESLDDEVDLHLRVSVMLAAGRPRDEVRSMLGLTADDMRAILGRLRRCAFLMDPNVRRAA